MNEKKQSKSNSQTINREKYLQRLKRQDPLFDYHVWWDGITQSDVHLLNEVIENATSEQEMQSYLEKHPLILAQLLPCGIGRWIIPKKRLGCEYVTDFVIGNSSSHGFQWYAIELKSPVKKMFTKKGDPSADLNHAIRQILDWRAWLKSNQNYAAHPPSESGLGLADIDPNIPGLIIMGRATDADESKKSLRRQYNSDLGIAIHSYDWLVNITQQKVYALSMYPQGFPK